MALQQDDTLNPVLDDEESSESDEDPEENDDELDDHEEEDLNSPSTSSPAAISAVAVTMTPAPSTATTSATASVTVAVPVTSAVTVAAVPIDSHPERHHMMEIIQKPQVDESRRMFQRLWTDEDEIELLKGFLDYTTSYRGAGSGSSHHYDTAPFYEQIKSRLQLDFNKNQLVEKLRRLKRKYRNAMNKINSGKEISFKSPHDQSTFEISRKIWSDTGKIIGFEDNVLDDEENNNNYNNISLSLTPYSNPNFEVKVEDGIERKVGNSSGSSSRSRKRSRSKSGRNEEDKRMPSDGFVVNNANHNESGGGGGSSAGGGGGGGGGGGNAGGGCTGGGVGGNLAGIVEDTVKSCLSPLLKEVMNGTAAAALMMGGTPYGGAVQGMGLRNPVAVPPPLLPPLPPLGFAGTMGLNGGGGVGEVVNERWRKQQILELEVYLRRLELVQDQIRAALVELRSMGGG